MGKKLLIVNQKSHSLTVEIANAFVKSGKYDSVVLALGNRIDPEFKLNESVKLQHICNYNIKSTRSRLISWVIATIQIVFLCWIKYRKYELFLISNPPTTAFIHKFCRNRYSTLIFDVFPEGLREYAPQGSFIYKKWRQNNIKFYKKAEYVFTISEGLKDTISQYCDKDKIEVVSLWASPHLPVIKVPQEENPFIIQNSESLKGKFIVMYSGNLGKAHSLDCLIEVADKLRSHEDIVFLFVGEGYGKKPLMDKVKQLGLESTCVFMPYQPVEVLPYSLSCSNLSVVSAIFKGKSSCLPSKIFDLIKLGKAILCIAEDDVEISQMVKKHDIGVNYSSSNIDGICDFIIDMYNNPNKIKRFEDNSFACSGLYTNKLAEKFVK